MAAPSRTNSTTTARTSAGPLRPFLANSTKRAKFTVTPRRATSLPHVEHLLAGVAEADITPPPGLPKAGYSRNAQLGIGFRTRLRARVVHLRCGDVSLAHVACDLLGGSSVLQHLVAAAVAERTDIPLAGIMIGATHTHAGPGQFLGTDFYNTFASNKPGFDPDWTQYLVDRIAGAIIEAHDSRVPAKLAIGSTEVWGLTRNRSLDPHVHNDTVIDKRTDPQRKWVSINPELHLLRVDTVATDTAASAPLGALVVFGVHGTGVPFVANEYNADLWAYVVGELRDGIETRTGVRPIAGAVQGTHADVAPALRPGLAGHLDAKRVGRGIGAQAAQLWESLGDQLDAAPALGVAYREIDLETSTSKAGVTLPRRPAVGAALIAGAHENLTPVVWRIPPFRAGTPKPHRSNDAHGAKWIVGSRWLQPVILPLRSFPRILPAQVFRIGDTVLAGLPFEITVETGRRWVAAVNAVGDSPINRVIVASVTNEYSGYVTTPEEYSRQFYEGGHTIYGPRTSEFLGAHVAELVTAVLDRGIVDESTPKRSWSLGIKRYLSPISDDAAAARRFDGAAEFHDPSALEEGFWEAWWTDCGPAGLAWDQSLVRIEQSDRPAGDADGTWTEISDDDSWDVEITHHGRSADGHRYRVRWFDPPHRFGRSHRMVLATNNDRPEVVGAPFD